MLLLKWKSFRTKHKKLNTLHSNMLLLKSCHFLLFLRFFLLYIPICFYLNPSLFSPFILYILILQIVYLPFYAVNYLYLSLFILQILNIPCNFSFCLSPLFFHYLRSTITKNYWFCHFQLPKIP